MLIDLLIVSRELPPRRLGLEQCPSEVTLFAQAKEEMALWDLILFQYLGGGYRESGPSLGTKVYSKAMRDYNQTETEMVLSK